MITKATEQLIVEGFVLGERDRERPQERWVRKRIEINTSSGLIESVGEPRGTGDLILGDEYFILPGFVDLHVHAREDVSGLHAYKETFESASLAAIHGGVTAFADMPNNPEPPADEASYAAKREVAKSAHVDVLLYAAAGPRTRPLSFPAPYKVYMAESVGGFAFRTEDELRETLAKYRGLCVAFHAEDPAILERARHAPSHAKRRPPEAEVRAIEKALGICESFHIEAHICHVSTAEGLEAIRKARRAGLGVTCEVTPHHLFYDQDNVSSYVRPSFLQVNPPIRSRLDRIALLEGLKSGDIDCLASDHAPHTIEEKEAGASGLPQLDTLGAFAWWLAEEGVSWEAIRRSCAEAPGKFLSRYLRDRYGKIEPGFVGSLTILRRRPYTVRRGDLRTRAGWSPFEGCTFPGRVSHTVVRGKIYPQIED